MFKEENLYKIGKNAIIWSIILCLSYPSLAFQTSRIIVDPKTNSYFTFKDGREINTDLNNEDFSPNKENADRLISISSLVLTRKMTNRCQKQEFKLEKLKASIHGDTLVLTFRNNDVPLLGINNKMLEICLLHNEVISTNFYHSSDKLRILENSSGGSQLVPALKSKIEELKLTLNSVDFMPGMILKGDLKLEASYNPSSKYRRIDEKMSGKFRCIVE